MKKNYYLFMMLTCFLAVVSCRKDNGDNNEIKGQLLTGKNWILTAYTEGGKDALNDTYEACERDNIEKFFSGGRYVQDEGASKCDPNDPQILVEGKWTLEGNKLTLSEDGLPIQIQVTIRELTNTRLRYSYINPFDSEEYVFTFTAK